MQEISVYNSLTRQKEPLRPIEPGFIGMYVCGPTVYSDVHLGNCRTFVSFDVIYRYLMYAGYKVRYVRNITDVGHLENDADIGGEDKISKKARQQKLEPMEVVQHYMNGFHDMMRVFNTLKPNIEPRATGHILEQIEMVQQILENGYAYEVNGSVYFNTLKFSKDFPYGELSGRKIEELVAESRDDLKHQDEKRHPSDFAIWIKADPEHLMRWRSPWSEGFPGWHLECSVMSTKYLGKQFDIHGGGNDLKFPHHENEVAQNYGACKCAPANYWLHANMLLMNGKKMSKSIDPETGLSNSITPQELFSGENANISKGYSPMVIRFFMLQSHYSSTLDLTDEALLAAEKGYHRLMEAVDTLDSLRHPGGGQDGQLNKQIKGVLNGIHKEMNDDFNTPKALGKMFGLVNLINGLKGGQRSFDDLLPDTLSDLQRTFRTFIDDIFGLRSDSEASAGDAEVLDGVMDLVLDLRQEARTAKNYATSDQIRDKLQELGITVKDGAGGADWSLN